MLPEKFSRRSTIYRKQWTRDWFGSELESLIARESTNFNYKLGLNVLMVAVLSVIQMLRGSGLEPSMIGATRCSNIDWALYIMLLVLGLVMTLLAVCIQTREYEHKKHVGYTFVPGDFKCTRTNGFKLPLYGVICGLLCSSTGSGAGAFYNTLLL